MNITYESKSYESFNDMAIQESFNDMEILECAKVADFSMDMMSMVNECAYVEEMPEYECAYDEQLFVDKCAPEELHEELHEGAYEVQMYGGAPEVQSFQMQSESKLCMDNDEEDEDEDGEDDEDEYDLFAMMEEEEKEKEEKKLKEKKIFLSANELAQKLEILKSIVNPDGYWSDLSAVEQTLNLPCKWIQDHLKELGASSLGLDLVTTCGHILCTALVLAFNLLASCSFPKWSSKLLPDTIVSFAQEKILEFNSCHGNLACRLDLEKRDWVIHASTLLSKWIYV